MELKKIFMAISIVPTFLLISCGGGGESSSTVTNGSGSSSSAANSFTKVNKIITTNCTSCHGPFLKQGAPMSLTTYSQISTFASSISNRINKSEGDIQLMPFNKPKLLAADIAIIDSWIAEGIKNN